MTDLTREQLEALLDGATQGPWQADGEPWNRIVWSSAENRVCFMAHSNGLDDARDIATSNLVAAAPDIARQLLATMAERDEAQAAQAGVVERAAEMAAEIHSSLAAAIHSLADPSGVEALAALRAERDRMNQWRETAIVERDIYSEERDDALARLAAAEAEAQKREAGLESALRNLVDRDCIYDGPRLIITADSHGDAIRLASEARAALSAAPTGEESNG